MTTETGILHAVMIALTRAGARVFRNHVGRVWQGKPTRFPRAGTVSIHVQPGDVLLRGARMVRAGLAVGSSDVIGLVEHTIEPGDVGRKVAIFVACECKTEGGDLEAEQRQFLRFVKNSGGVAIVARSAGDAEGGILTGGNYCETESE